MLVVALLTGLALGVRAAYLAITAAAADDPVTVDTPEVTSAPEDAETTGPPTDDELANPVDCVPGAVAVSVGLPSSTLARGASTSLPVTVTNTGPVPCLVDVGRAQLVVEIHSGDDLVWSSQHCGRGERRVLLDIDGEDVTTFEWDGHRSWPSCPAKRPVAEPGTYRAVVTLTSAEGGGSELATTESVFTVR